MLFFITPPMVTLGLGYYPPLKQRRAQPFERSDILSLSLRLTVNHQFIHLFQRPRFYPLSFKSINLANLPICYTGAEAIIGSTAKNISTFFIESSLRASYLRFLGIRHFWLKLTESPMTDNLSCGINGVKLILPSRFGYPGPINLIRTVLTHRCKRD